MGMIVTAFGRMGRPVMNHESPNATTPRVSHQNTQDVVVRRSSLVVAITKAEPATERRIRPPQMR